MSESAAGSGGTDGPPAEPTAELDDQPPTPRSTVRPRRFWVGWGLLALGVLVLVTAGWATWRGYSAYRHLQSAQQSVSTLQAQVKDLTAIDAAATAPTVQELQQQASAARDATRDPVFRLYSHLPWLGANLRAEAVAADVVNDLASKTVPALLDVATTIDPKHLAPHGGRIDVDAISRVAPTVISADTAVIEAQARIDGIDRSGLARPVSQALDSMSTKLDSLRSSTSSAALLARLVPPMLGASGVRRYAVVFQNLAEARATGGIFGSYALLTVDHGQLTIGTHGAVSRTIADFDPPLPAGATLNPTLYGRLPGRYPTDVNLTPDYPTAASLFATMFQQRVGTAVDGVIAVDPVALSYLMAGITPIDVGHGVQLSAANVVEVLLEKAYALFPTDADVAARDAFLGQATVEAFSAITQSSGDAGQEMAGVKRAISDGRLLIWSAHSAEQADLAPSGVGGRLPDADSSTAPTIGVFRNDGTGGKLGFYAAGKISVSAGSCRDSSTRELTVTAQLSNSSPALGLPDYVLGLAKAGQYVQRTNVMLFAPTGGSVASVTVAGKQVPVTYSSERGRAVAMVTVDLRPGTTKDVVARVLAPAQGRSERVPRVVVTPGVADWPVQASTYAGCG